MSNNDNGANFWVIGALVLWLGQNQIRLTHRLGRPGHKGGTPTSRPSDFAPGQD